MTVHEIEALKDARPLPEPQYETDDYYAVTGFATTLTASLTVSPIAERAGDW